MFLCLLSAAQAAPFHQHIASTTLESTAVGKQLLQSWTGLAATMSQRILSSSFMPQLVTFINKWCQAQWTPPLVDDMFILDPK